MPTTARRSAPDLAQTIDMSAYWMKVALGNLLAAACLGVVLRFAFVVELSWLEFRQVLHAHSHVAMLGWVYLALFGALVETFLGEGRMRTARYRILFWLTQISVLGMLLTFPVEGYGPFSIAFSTAHVLLSYVFAYRFWRDLEAGPAAGPSLRFARGALVFMILSTLALWAMGPIILFGLQGSAFYYMSVQFFLHFQFNGWFLFAVFALLFHHWKEIPQRPAYWFFTLLAISCLLTYALAVAWSNPQAVVFWTNGVGVTLQLGALGVFWKKLYPGLRPTLAGPAGWLLRLALFCWALKVLIQAAVLIPYIATVAYTIRNYVIGFMHLLLLGVITHFLFGYAARHGWLVWSARTARIGIALFFAGFVLSELLLFLQGTMFWGALGFLPFYYEALTLFSLLLPLGVLGLLVGSTIPGWRHHSRH